MQVKGKDSDFAYVRNTPRSLKLFKEAKKVFAGGVNHNARLYAPYPLFIKRARGSRIWDVDGNEYVDYWMGHMALILGHSPTIVVDALREQIGNGTHFGMGSRLSLELGEEIQRSVPNAEMLRFCNSGAEATMYLVRLARAYARKRVVVKMTGGWHGYNTDLNKGVHRPFRGTEGEGILPEEQAHVKSVRFNDLEAVRNELKESRGDVAAVFLEPVLGAGGCIPADIDYIRGLRELTDREGVILAFDEIITGFRVSLGGAQERYGIKPDLAAMGKIVGGGLPIGLVCGNREIISMADPSRKGRFVSIGGGTFSENPLSMVAGLTTLRHLRKNRGTIYPRLESSGRKLRSALDKAFADSGVMTNTTGMGSLFLTHFGKAPRNAEDSASGSRESIKSYGLWLMAHGIFILPGHVGAISTAHKATDLRLLVSATRGFARSNIGHTNREAKVTS
jgi:glutamate-1-semialdehyde 2,1-aminomutase